MTLKKKGFTLIETTIYIALFALLLSGAIGASFGFIDSSKKSTRDAFTAEEALFIIQKINWLIANALITEPALDHESEVLSVTKTDELFRDNPFVMKTQEKTLHLKRGSSQANILHKSNDTLEYFLVNRTKEENREKIFVSFTLNGIPYSEYLFITKK